MGFCSILANCDDFVEIAAWAQHNQAFFRTFLEFPHGILSHDTFNRVFSILSPAILQEVLLPWLLERRGVPGDLIHDIAKIIVEGKGDYVLAVKDNQPTLHAEIQAAFA